MMLRISFQRRLVTRQRAGYSSGARFRFSFGRYPVRIPSSFSLFSTVSPDLLRIHFRLTVHHPISSDALYNTCSPNCLVLWLPRSFQLRVLILMHAGLMTFFVILFSPSKQILGVYLIVDHDHFLPRPSKPGTERSC